MNNKTVDVNYPRLKSWASGFNRMHLPESLFRLRSTNFHRRGASLHRSFRVYVFHTHLKTQKWFSDKTYKVLR